MFALTPQQNCTTMFIHSEKRPKRGETMICIKFPKLFPNRSNVWKGIAMKC